MNADHNPLPRAMSLAVHELRTPVSVVSGYLRMLLREQAGPLTDSQRQMLEEADRSCARVIALISEMSELGTLASADVRLATAPVDAAALVAEIARDVDEGKERGVRLETQSLDQPMMVMGDRARLATALEALMRAALRERNEPGTIVAAWATATEAHRSWAAVAIGEEPVARALLDHAQTPGPALDDWRSGLGLALPIARRVIEAHGGALWAPPGEALPGFLLRLPLLRQD